MVTKWLITGGCGFIGTQLVSKLTKYKNNKIIIIDDLSNGSKKELSKICSYKVIKSNGKFNWSNIVTLVVGNISNYNLAVKLSKSADIIVHLAADTSVINSLKYPSKNFFINVCGTFNYLEAARINRVKRFIFSSSGAVVGEIKPPIHEELNPNPISPYGASKLTGETYCKIYNNNFNIKIFCLRFSNVYGPGSYNKNSVIAKFIKKIISGKKFEIYGDGNQTRDFIYIDDLIEAIIKTSIIKNISGGIFQIATSREDSINNIVNYIKKLFIYFGYNNIKFKNISKMKGEIERNYALINKARKVLDWKPKILLEDGLERTIKYFIEYKK